MKMSFLKREKSEQKSVKQVSRRMKIAIISIIAFLILSAIPLMSAEPDVTITINFVDQDGGDLSVVNEKVYIDGHGWKTDGQTFDVAPGTTIYYRGYYSQSSGLYGPKDYESFSTSGTLEVEFRILDLKFEDQSGDIGAGDERVYIDYVGYKQRGDDIIVPQDSTLRYRAYYKTGSGLYGDKETELIDVEDDIIVKYRTFTVEFTSGLTYTNNERVYIDYVGYKENNDDVTVPKDSTVRYRMYYKAGSGLYGTKGSVKIETGSETFNPNFKTVTLNFIDQDGNDLTTPTATGNERAYIDYIGYKQNGDTIIVPDDSSIRYRAYYKAGSGLYGNKITQPVAAISVVDISFNIVDINFIDQYGDNLMNPPATGNERVYIDYVGYKPQDSQIVVPEDCTVRHRAYYKQGSGLYGNKISTKIEANVDSILVKFKIIEVNLKDQDGEPERRPDGADTGNERAYIDYIGYVSDGAELVVPLGSYVRNRAYYKQSSGLYGQKDTDNVVTCQWDVLNVEYKRLTLIFVDQDGNDIGAGNERVYIDYVGYKQNGDVLQVPVGSTLRYRAYYKQSSGLYGPKESIVIDCTFDTVEVKFKRIEIELVALQLTGNERIYMDYVGYLGDGTEIIVPFKSTIRYRAYYKQGSGLYGPKISEYVDCDEDILEVEFWMVQFKVIDKGVSPEQLTAGAQVYVDYVGYVANDGIITVPLDSTTQFKAKVGNKWSAKTTKKVEQKWNLAIYEWDSSASSFSGPTYYTEVTFNLCDQNGAISSSPGYTGNERVYVETLGAYKTDGYTHRFVMGTNVKFRAYYKVSGWNGPNRYSQALIVKVMFHTLTFDFKDQNGDIITPPATGNERVYVESVAKYFADAQSIAVPLDATMKYRGYYKVSGLNGPNTNKIIDTNVDSFFDVFFQTLTFDFKDQYGDLTGTSDERVYVESVAKYYVDGGSISVPRDAQIKYRGYYKVSELNGPNTIKTITGSMDIFDIHFQTVIFNFIDQNGDLTVPPGTGNERVYVESVAKYYVDGGSISVPRDAQIKYRGYYTVSGLQGPNLLKTLDIGIGILDIQFWTVKFRVEDTSSNLIPGAQVYVDSVAKYVSNDGEITFPVDSTIKHRAKVDGQWSSTNTKKVDKSWTICTYVCDKSTSPYTYSGPTYNTYTNPFTLNQVTFKFVDQYGTSLPAGTQRIIIDGVSGYKADDYTMTGLTNGQTIKYKPYYSSSGNGKYIVGTQQTFTWSTGQKYQSVEFHRVMFNFVDQGSNNVVIANHRIHMTTSGGHDMGYRADGTVEYLPLGSTIKYTARYSSTGNGRYIKGTEQTYNADSTTPIEDVEFHRVKFNFIDQYGDGIVVVNHRLHMTTSGNHDMGYRAHGTTEYLPLGSTIKYTARYSSTGNGRYIKGTEQTYNADSTTPIEDVEFHKVTLNFVDQYDNVIVIGNHRIHMTTSGNHDMGYRAHETTEYLPLGSTIKYTARYSSTGNGRYIKGTEQTYNADSTTPVEDVEFHRVVFEFQEQYGNVISGTQHRIHMTTSGNHDMGYRAHGTTEYLPKGSTIKYTSRYSSTGNGKYIIGTEQTYNADSTTPIEVVEFHRVKFCFVDQNLDPVCGSHKIHMTTSGGHDMGYRGPNTIEYLPKGSTIKYTARYSSSGNGKYIKGDEVTYVADSCRRIERVRFHKVIFYFEDQDGNEISSTQHKVHMTTSGGHDMGYRSHGTVEYLPLGSSIKYTARYSSSGNGKYMYGPTIIYNADSTVPIEVVKFQELTCRVKDPSGNLITGAKIYIYSSGSHSVAGITNGGTVIIPLDATIKHKGFVPTNKYSSLSTVLITKDILGINYVYDSSTDIWTGPTYNKIWYVDASYSGTETGSETQPYNTIMEAVNAAIDGDRIKVGSGTYTEQVLINKDLDIESMSNPKIVAPDTRSTYTFAESSSTWDPVVFAYGGTLAGSAVSGTGVKHITLGGFEIDGGNKAGSARFTAILYRNVEGSISNNYVHDMYDSDGEGDGPETFGISVYGDSDVTVEYNEIHDFSRGGIGINGDNGAAPDPISEVRGNTVYGNGLETGTGWWAENGIQIGWGAYGDVRNNEVYDCRVNSEIWGSTGIMIYNGVDEIIDNYVENCDMGIYTSVDAEIKDNEVCDCDWGIVDLSTSVIENNDVHDNEYGMYIDSDSTIQYNEVYDNDYGIMISDPSAVVNYNNIENNLNYGIYNYDTTTVDAENNWWGSSTGPTHSGNSGGTGDAASDYVDYNPWLGKKGVYVTVYLKDSAGNLMDTGSNIKYKVGSTWHTFGTGTTSGGKVSDWISTGSYYFQLTHTESYTTNTIYQNIGTNPIVVFQTVKVTMELRCSMDCLMDTGSNLKYKIGSTYPTFGSGTTTNGQETDELLPGSYYFYLTHTESSTSGSIYQNIGTNPVVTFRTVKVTIELRDSSNTLMDTGSNLKYKVGSTYPTFGSGSTSGGAVGQETDELLPGSYYFYLTHTESTTSGSIYQNIGTNPTVTFRTVKVTIEFRDSSNTLMDTGSDLKYKVGSSYPTFGSGSTSGGAVGQETDELLPGSYYFYLTHTESTTSGSIYQNIGTNPIVTFQTVKVTIELRDSSNTLMDTGSNLKYKIGSTYPTFGSGSTSGGAVGQETDELLPGSYYFYLTHTESSTSGSIYQNIGTNPIVTFQTVKVTIELRDSSNTLMDTGSNLKYKIGSSYPTFGSGSTSGGAVGQETQEMLPGSYYFYLTHTESATSGQIYQNIGSNPTITFKTAKVQEGIKDCTHYKVGSTWHSFTGTSMQMLTGSYYFKFSDSTTSYIAIAAGVNILP